MATLGETKAPRALTMATYLRAVVGRASERLAVPVVAVAAASPGDNQQENDEDDEDKLKTPGEYETASSSDTMEEIVESPVQRGDREEPQFAIHVEPSRCEDNVTVGDRSGKLRWAFCDVLLQPDEDGLGLNLSVRTAPHSLRAANKKPRDVVVVESFRRLHADDVGPAEASGKIQSGDVLWAIDGERMRSLESVATCVSRRSNVSRGFYLMRFVRPVVSAEFGAIESVVDPDALSASGATDALPFNHTELRPDVARLIRELVVRNQSLEHQLLASRLKQDEQRIQLDQLHALYAKTQLENWSAFSLPKPFSLRGPFANESSATGAKSSRVPTLTGAAARLMGASAMQYDVEFAVNAERERLTRQFELQLETEKTKMQSRYDAKVAAMRAAMGKKLCMLEFAVKELLSSPLLRSVQVEDESGTPTEFSPHVLALRHQLFHRAKDSDNMRTTHADCLLCLLEKECDGVMEDPTSNQQEDWRNQVSAILDEYSTLKTARERLLEGNEQIANCEETQTFERPGDTGIDAKTQPCKR